MRNYHIRLSGIKDGKHNYNFNIEKEFFESFKGTSIKDGRFNVHITLSKKIKHQQLFLKIDGNIFNMSCDMCGEKLTVPISSSFSMLIKESNTNEIHTDKVYFILPNQYELDASQLIYESIVFSIPSKISHVKRNECNKTVIELTQKYSKKRIRQDPRWELLNKIK